MAIDKLDVIDFIHLDDEYVVLTIADAMDWVDEHQHLYMLQEKVNRYLEFVESGQIVENYPLCVGKKVMISVKSLYNYPKRAVILCQKIEKILNKNNYSFEYGILEE